MEPKINGPQNKTSLPKSNATQDQVYIMVKGKNMDQYSYNVPDPSLIIDLLSIMIMNMNAGQKLYQ